MPGNDFLHGVTHPTDINDVEVIIAIDIVETQYYCTKYAPLHQVILNCITNACFIPACAIPIRDGKGGIEKCYIYSWAEFDFLIEHERRHCEGYKDIFY